MSKALGLVETRGLIAAIEAADAMLKAANVTFAGKERVDPAMITIKVTGDVAAVKAAVEAGAAAAQRVGQLISTHIIAQPDEQLSIFLPEITDKEEPLPEPEKKNEEIKKEVKKETVSSKVSPAEIKDIPKSITKIKEEVESFSEEEIHIEENAVVSKQAAKPPVKEPDSSLFDSESDTITRLRNEALGINKNEEPDHRGDDDKRENPETEIDLSSLTDDYLYSLNVHLLRKLARSIKTFPIQGRQISMAGKQELLDLFNKLRS